MPNPIDEDCLSCLNNSSCHACGDGHCCGEYMCCGGSTKGCHA